MNIFRTSKEGVSSSPSESPERELTPQPLRVLPDSIRDHIKNRKVEFINRLSGVLKGPMEGRRDLLQEAIHKGKIKENS